jgi:orotidine-5'-phosphate decarboxylase
VTATPIVALDVSDLHAARSLVNRLGAACEYYKVGSELFTAVGPQVVRDLREQGKGVFVDLKLHDIPNTVRNAAAAAASMGATLLTVHATGGLDMVRAAVDGAGQECGVLAVTVLTSMDAASIASAWGRDNVDISTEVVRLAKVAVSAGAHGIVCSGGEVAAVRAASEDRLAALVPGIRFADGSRNDQQRVVTPYEAARAGARYLILGRAVTAAADPVLAFSRVGEELDRAALEGHRA